ncbi:hypothetical protein CPC735_045900 [Coccidioides posadasii C735 delta SOWgp]|uniref:Prokaryotic-type class I peptide chain release factors domain-containing protein n=3 Tax=Coccidioides posadasii TaxID=199306 RepID=E9D9Z3_COCPS|nr:hypothetical protein CPC735_045900 [Coccidioides posadasii C735 delta SOWgp]EER23220.1 hypothetical protein CPC735_045900 [Coccidioides posadasii C735 delta SOWgp]EFW16724.1 hypothetical protein CPSG_06683 [Coccidioides posadasii str. Silveira]KMM64514.1 peptidyl-tRNA hydrolase domain-containing protein [Coccidioides posadasii RMSCC 3488]|eukprot:XP_003065365.1 hypothetical protein CPC735_045900 [Coccidioides posadasii C735 delta SOWgp]
MTRSMFAWRGCRQIPLLDPPHWLAIRPFLSRRALRQSPQHGTRQNAEDLQTARSWLSRLSSQTIPRSICEISFSRSSGPGGQNVNKVNSKVTLRVPLGLLFPLVPSVLHHEIRSSRYLAGRTDSLVIQSDETRKQSQNLELCFEKLRDVLAEAGKAAIPGETSAEQRKRVKELQNRANEARIRMKKVHSNKKNNRKGKGYDD